jgi:phage shock protein PspC (stress-responsive transcriptional regulator)
MTDTPGATPGEAPPPPGAAPPPTPPPPPRRLVKRRGMIWGVAAGLGEYFQVDPLVFRIAFVVLAFFGGVGALLYVVAALLMPSEHHEPPVHDMMRRFERSPRHRWLGLILIAVAVGLILSNVHGVHFGLIWGLALIAIGVLLFQAEPGSWAVPATAGPPPPAPPEPPADSGRAPASTTQQWSTPSWGGARRGHYGPPWRRRSGPPIGWITLALALVAVGVAVMLGNAGAISLTVGSTLAIALGVIGAGLLVAAFVGRGRVLLFVLGLLLLPVVAAGSLVDEPLGGGLGDRLYAPTSAAAVQSQYDIAAGQLTLNFLETQLGDTPRTVHASVAFGHLYVYVPDQLPVLMHAHSGAGDIQLVSGRHVSGIQISDDVSYPGSSTMSPLTLDLRVGMGSIEVIHIANPGAVQ